MFPVAFVFLGSCARAIKILLFSSLFRVLSGQTGRHAIRSGGAQWIISPSRARARATGRERRTRTRRGRQRRLGAHDEFPRSSPAGRGGLRGREAVGRQGDRRLEEAGRRRTSRVGAASRAGPRLQQGRALERAHRAHEGGGREGDLVDARGEGRAPVRDGRRLSRRLKLDVMVVNTYNAILAFQPTTSRRSTRWPRSTST